MSFEENLTELAEIVASLEKAIYPWKNLLKCMKKDCLFRRIVKKNLIRRSLK